MVRLTDNTVENSKVSLTKQYCDNRMYVINPRNFNIDDLSSYGDQRLITRQQIYHVDDDISERFNSGSIVDAYTNRM